MQCIWKGDLHIEESMTELICIIDSLEKWILDDFRPWVSGNLGRLYRKMDLKVENDGGGGDFSSNEEEASDDLQDSVSETSEEYVETDDEEKKWDEDWIASVSEESDSELDADSEDYDEYEQDLARADSLMEEVRDCLPLSSHRLKGLTTPALTGRYRHVNQECPSPVHRSAEGVRCIAKSFIAFHFFGCFRAHECPMHGSVQDNMLVYAPQAAIDNCDGSI